MGIKKKALIVATVASTIDQFCVNDISLLLGKYEVHVAANFSSGNNTSKERLDEFRDELCKRNIQIHDIEFDRHPISRHNLAAYKSLKSIVRHDNFDLIHCHTPVAAMITRLVAKPERARGTTVFYTAHGFHFYSGAPLLNWILYYPIERWLAKYTDVLITINDEDYRRASQFASKRTVKLPGVGIKNTPTQSIISNIETRRRVRTEFGIPLDAKVLVSVGELNRNKNHIVVLRAIAKFNRDDFIYIICGLGAQSDNLKRMCGRLGISEKVFFLGFRNDIPDILKASDIFVFPSKREGLPIALLEALQAGLPVVCSDIRGNRDIVDNGRNGILVASDSARDYADAIIKILDDNKGLCEDAISGEIDLEEYKMTNIQQKVRELYADYTR